MSDYYDHEDPTPVLDEVQQFEPAAECLDVNVEGPVRTHALPARHAVAHNITVTTTATQVLGKDQRRARVLIWGSLSANADTVVDAAEVTATSNSSAIAAPDAATFTLGLQVDNTAGTTPTLDVDVEWSLDGGTTWFTAEGDTDDFTQVTTTDTNLVATLTRRAPHYRLAYTVAGTDSPSYTVTATQYAPDATAEFYLGTRDDEVQSGTAALVRTGERLELLNAEPVYVKAASGTVVISFVAEHWAD
jgi:hypothetical protein